MARTSVLFAGAGLDRALKRLAEDALPVLVQFDDEVNKKFTTYAQDAITDAGSVDPKQLVALLLGRGDSPRDTLVKSWIYTLGSASAQSAERVAEFAGALGVTDKELRKRMTASPTKSSKLEKAFSARNEIAHELDVTDPEAETRKRLVACHEHGTAVSGFLPASWDHLGCQSWDRPARRVGGRSVCSLNRHVVLSDVEVISGGISGGRCG